MRTRGVLTILLFLYHFIFYFNVFVLIFLLSVYLCCIVMFLLKKEGPFCRDGYLILSSLKFTETKPGEHKEELLPLLKRGHLDISGFIDWNF